MNTPISRRLAALLSVSLLALPLQTRARVVSSASNVTASAYAEVSRGPHSRVMQRSFNVTNALGLVTAKTASYVEMATGLSFLSNGVYVAASPQIQTTAQGGQCTNCQHSVFFNANLSDGVDLITPDGHHMTSTVAALAYSDGTTNVIIATPQDSVGQILPSLNQVIFTNYFGALADVIFQNSISGFSQDIVIRQQLPAQVGLTGSNLWLQVWTEFTASPSVAISTNPITGDQILNFGTMQMGKGRAFMLGTNAASAPVTKQWLSLGGRTFLIESVLLNALGPQLERLPGGGQSKLHLPHQPMLAKAAPPPTLKQFNLPARRVAKKSPSTMRLASQNAPTEGLLLDYDLSGSLGDFTFQSDTEYFITNVVNISGTATFERQTVLKFAANTNATIIAADTVWNTAPYGYAYFTGKDDDTVGAQIDGSTGSPAGPYGLIGLNLESSANQNVSNARFSFLNAALAGSQTVRDVQFNSCGTVMAGLDQGIDDDSSSTFYNVLFCNIGTFVGPQHDGGQVVHCCNCTIDGCGEFFVNGASSAYFINSIVSGVGTWNAFSISTNDSVIDDDGSSFQSVGAGGFYLTTGSPYHGACSTSIDPTLMADLQQKTTYPPMWFTNPVTMDTVLPPQIPRDNGGASLDMGYHYDPIDLLASCTVSNATLTLTNGVVLAYYNNIGIWLQNGSQLVSQGTPNQHNGLLYYGLVQEQATTLWDGETAAYAVYNSLPVNPYHDNTSQNPSMYLRFTTISAVNGCSFLVNLQDGDFCIGNLTLRDCEIYGAGGDWSESTGTSTPVEFFENNLFHRAVIDINSSGQVVTFNNLFVANTNVAVNIFNEGSSTAWTNQNNAFDGGNVYMDGAIGYNAYLNGSVTNNALQGSDVLAALTWVTGPLGNFYQPTGSALANIGSASATNFGLYYYTVTTNQVPEGTNTVSIGYHYVAVDGSGQPDDTLWTGIPDYLADTNGALPTWEMKYFGHLGINPNGDYDNDGTDNLQEYLNGTDPNKIWFFLSETNQYVNTNMALLTVAVLGGVPSNIAVLVDSTNFTGASWSSYASSNTTVNLGMSEGWHDIWLGLRGLPLDATQTWHHRRFKFDVTPPLLVITAPTNSTIDVPIIQLQGHSPEALASITYDLTNAAGLVTNQQVFVLNQSYSTNTLEFTTNTFQAFDVPLTNGVNTFTLHAADLAGNITTSNVSFTLDYSGKTNAPIVTLIWPQNGMLVCGTNFIWNGSVSDPTASVAAQMVDTNGITNVFSAAVGRDGIFWLQNLPLNSGTNLFTLCVTDVVGHVAITNVSFVRGDAGLAIDPIPTNQTTVTGEINSTNYSVSVSGVLATVSSSTNANGVYTWEADNVPIPPNNSLVQATATPNSGPAPDQSAAAIAGNSSVYVSAYHRTYEHVVTAGWTLEQDNELDWADGSGGQLTAVAINNFSGPYDEITTESWPASNWPQPGPNGTGTDVVNGATNWQVTIPPFSTPAWEHCDDDFEMTYPEDPVDMNETYQKNAQTTLTLATGGQPGSTSLNLWMVSASATAETFISSDELPDDPPVDYPVEAVPFNQIIAGAFGPLDSEGNAFKMLPDNSKVDVTTYVAGANHYSFTDPPGPVGFTSLTVVSNSATQVSGTNNWAAVKTATNAWVYVQATLSTSDPNVANNIQWTGGEPVPGNPFQRRVTKTTSAETTVTATIGSVSKSLNVWIIWADLTIKVSGTLDADDKAVFLVNSNSEWPTPAVFNVLLFGGGNGVGGGTGLGPIDCLSNTNLNYCYTVGRMEAKAILQPSGIGNLITNGWDMRRIRFSIFWNNGGSPAYSSGGTIPPSGVTDTGGFKFKYLNPAHGDIFDLDFPGCPSTFGTNINHTAEHYGNYYQYVTIDLSAGPQVCSTTNTYSYEAQIDTDATTPVQANVLSTSTITLPTNSIYTTR